MASSSPCCSQEAAGGSQQGLQDGTDPDSKASSALLSNPPVLNFFLCEMRILTVLAGNQWESHLEGSFMH